MSSRRQKPYICRAFSTFSEDAQDFLPRGPIDFPADSATMTLKESAVPKTATRKSPVPNPRSFSQALEAFLKVDPRRLPEKGKLTTKLSPRKKKRRS